MHIAEQAARFAGQLVRFKSLADSVFQSMRGLDILQPLIDDPEVTEIMVNGYEDIFYEKNGVLYKSNVHFRDQKPCNSKIQYFHKRRYRIGKDNIFCF